MKRPRRMSIGCYAVESGGHVFVLQRMGRRGFKIVMRAGALSPVFRRLRDAEAAAIMAANPWPFDVPKAFDAALDIPPFLIRRMEAA